MGMESPIYGQALSFNDIVARQAPDGMLLNIIEIIKQSNPIMDDIRWVATNQNMFHIAAQRTGYPQGTYRAFYQGVPTEKSTNTQIQEGVSMLETFLKPDKRLVEMQNNPQQFLMGEVKGAMTGLAETQANTLFYGNVALNPNQFNGLATRYNQFGTNPSLMSYNVIDAGGVGDNLTSIWLVSWGDDKVFGLYPKNSTAGLRHKDLGPKIAQDPNGNEYETVLQKLEWDMGLMVSDWRYVVRIANVDIASLAAAGTDNYTGPRIDNLVWDAIGKFPNQNPEGMNFYCSPLVWVALHKLANNKSNQAVSIMEWNGRPMPTINGAPIKVCDAISQHERPVEAA